MMKYLRKILGVTALSAVSPALAADVSCKDDVAVELQIAQKEGAVFATVTWKNQGTCPVKIGRWLLFQWGFENDLFAIKDASGQTLAYKGIKVKRDVDEASLLALAPGASETITVDLKGGYEFPSKTTPLTAVYSATTRGSSGLLSVSSAPVDFTYTP